MARVNITDTTATNAEIGRVRRCLITVNNGFTGTIIVRDGTTDSDPTIATVTNPSTGDRYEYWDFATGVRVTLSATGDVTVNTSNTFGAR